MVVGTARTRVGDKPDHRDPIPSTCIQRGMKSEVTGGGGFTRCILYIRSIKCLNKPTFINQWETVELRGLSSTTSLNHSMINLTSEMNQKPKNTWIFKLFFQFTEEHFQGKFKEKLIYEMMNVHCALNLEKKRRIWVSGTLVSRLSWQCEIMIFLDINR